MGELGYQDLLSKCIEGGLPGGGNLISSSKLEVKADPAAGKGRFLENSTSGSREDTSGASAGSLAESDVGHSRGTGMDATGLEKRNSQVTTVPKSVGAGRLGRKALRTEELKIDKVPLSLLKSMRTSDKVCPAVLASHNVEGCNARNDSAPPMFSFRSLIEGAISASRVRPCTTSRNRAEPDKQGIPPSVEPQNSMFLAEKRPPPVRSALFGDRNDAVCKGNSTPRTHREKRLRPGKGMPESWVVQKSAPRTHGSGSSIKDTVGDNVPHVSYASLLQAQLGGSHSQRTLHKNAGNTEPHSSSVNLLSQSVEVKNGFLSLLTQTTPLLSSVSVRVNFPPPAPNSIDKKTSDFRLFEESSRDHAVHDSRSPNNIPESDLLKTSARPGSPLLTRLEENASQTEVLGPFSSLVADSTCNYKGVLDAQLRIQSSDSFAVYESRFIDIPLEKDTMGSSEAAVVPASSKQRSKEEDVPSTVVLDRESFLLADSPCTDERMSELELLEELSRALALHESRFAESVLNGDAMDSSDAAVGPALLATRTKEDDSQAEVVMPNSVPTHNRILNVQFSEKASSKFAVRELQLAVNLLKKDCTGLSETAALSTSSLTGIDEDVPARRIVVEMDAELCGDPVVYPERGRNNELNFIPMPNDSALANPSHGPVFDDISQASLESLEIKNLCAEGQMDSMRLGTTLQSSCQAVGNQLRDVIGDSEETLRDNMYDAQVKCGTHGVSETIEIEPIDATRFRDLMVCNAPVQGLVFKEPADMSNDERLFSKQEKAFPLNSNVTEENFSLFLPLDGQSLDKEPCFVPGHLESPPFLGDGRSDRTDDRTAVGCSLEADLKQTEYVKAMFEKGHKDKTCNAQTSSAGKLLLKPETDKKVQDVMLEKESDISKCQAVHDVKDDLKMDALAEKSFSSVPLDGLVVIEESHAAPASLEVILACAEGGFEPLDAGDVAGPSWQAGPNHVKGTKGAVLIEQEDDLCDVQMIDSFMDQDAESEEQRLKGEDSGNGPQKSCVENAEITLTTSSLHVYRNLRVEERIHSNESNGMNSLIVVAHSRFADERAEQKHKLRRLEGFSDVDNHPEIEQHIVNIRAVKMPETQMAILSYSECQVMKQGDQLLSMDPDAISEGLRQVFLRDNDATLSDSLETIQVTEAGFGVAEETGREVQSLLERKFKERHLDDLRDEDSIHFKGRIRHLDDLEENGRQPCASQLIRAVHNQLAGTEVLDRKKKSRPRVYNHEKSLQGKGKSHFHVSGVERKWPLQTQKDSGNRCRRNRHIDPDHRVPVFIEGRDEGFEETNDGAFLRWLSYQDEGNGAPSPTAGKRPRKNSREMEKHIIAIPSFRVVADYENRQQEVETRRKILARSHTVRPSDYDMDDEDERWLHAWNKQLASVGLKQPISEDKFEEIIEFFERKATQLDPIPAADVLGHSIPGGSLRIVSPSGINQANLGVTVPENVPVLNPSILRSGHTWSAGEGAVASSSIQGDVIEREPASPASTVRLHTWASENEKNTCKFVVDTVSKRPSERSLQKSFDPRLLNSSDDCCICNGGKVEENKPVNTCKQCFVHVHQSCSGTRGKLHDDQSRVIAPAYSCALCPKKGGALKPTVVTQKWAHVTCALHTNETSSVDPDVREPIDSITAVVERAHEQEDRCGLCGMNKGICSVKGCRAPYRSSFKASQAALLELRQPDQEAGGVRSICPRHARTTPTSKDNLMFSCSISSEATPSGAAGGSISTASSTDCRHEGSPRQSISHQDVSFVQQLRRGKNSSTEVADFTDSVMSVNGKRIEDACRLRGIRFILKRRRDESCTQLSEDEVSDDPQQKVSNGTRDFKDKIEAQTCKSISHVVECGQKPKKTKFKVGGLAHNQHSESLPTLIQHECKSSEDLQPEKSKELLPVVDQLAGDAAMTDKGSQILRSLTEDRFVKEVKELIILEEAMLAGVAPLRVMREAFVYWRAKRAEHDGSLLREVHHEQLSKSQGIFNKDASFEENAAREKMGSLPPVPPAQQLLPMSSEKMLEKTKELRKQLEHLRTMSQMVVQREKLKYNRQLVLGTIAWAEQNKADNTSRVRYCVWCPSTKTLLSCQTCPRSFCFNCFKHRKGFGVKGWMAAMKQPLYRCHYCRKLSAKIADLSTDLNLAPKQFLGGGVISTSAIVGKPGGGDREKGIRKGRGKGRNWQESEYLIPAPFTLAEGGIMDLGSKTMYVNEESTMARGIRSGKGKACTRRENVGNCSPTRSTLMNSCNGKGVNNHGKPDLLETGLKKFLNTTDGEMEHSSFETTLLRLNLLRCTNADVHQDVTMSVGDPSKNAVVDFADAGDSGPVFRRVEGAAPSLGNAGNNFGLVSPSAAPSPALLVYKTKRKFILEICYIEMNEQLPSFGVNSCQFTHRRREGEELLPLRSLTSTPISP
uniref:PHD-type domain-containing protein n=1 Tax=Physcomitrium patens TaxID=3218 RepID=A0A7I4A9M5_PHYPA